MLKQGVVNLSVEYPEPQAKQDQQLLRKRVRRSTAELSIVSDRNILGEDLLFMGTVQYSAEVGS